MSLRKSKGNMYRFVSHTWNPIKGKCCHDCSYCYMRGFNLPAIRLDEKELRTNLGRDNFIFVGSGTDMFADDVPIDWIKKVMNRCLAYDNKYLFQSKNPIAFKGLEGVFDRDRAWWCTTIETNRDYRNIMREAPSVRDRVHYMSKIGGRKIVTVEPILDFDVDELADMILKINPKWINIGADSKGNNLPEPPAWKIFALIKKLSEQCEIKKKPNLERLLV